MKFFSLVLSLLTFNVMATNIDNTKNQIQRYDIRANIDHAQNIIHVEASLLMKLSLNTSIELILNKSAKIKTVTLDTKDIDFTFNKNGKTPNKYITDGRLLTLPVETTRKKSRVVILKYSLPIKDVNYLSSKNSNDLEMGLYSGWFPLNMDYGRFKYTIKLHLADKQLVTGNAKITKKANHWFFDSNIDGYDIVVVTSPNLEQHEFLVDDAALRIIDIKSDNKISDNKSVKKLARDAKRIIPYLQSKFGKTNGKIKDYQFVFVQRPTQPSYSRDGFVVISHSSNDEYDKILNKVSHEIGHFWWNKAPADTWEDWLNESFSEYSSLMAIEFLYGKNRKDRIIDRYRAETVNVPPIAGISRSANQVTAALYKKGPVILDDLRVKLGDESFFNLLHIINSENISNTKDLKLVLTRFGGAKISTWLEEQLNQ